MYLYLVKHKEILAFLIDKKSIIERNYSIATLQFLIKIFSRSIKAVLKAVNFHHERTYNISKCTYFPIMYPSRPAEMMNERSSTNIKRELEPDVLIGRSCGTETLSLLEIMMKPEWTLQRRLHTYALKTVSHPPSLSTWRL